MSEPSSDNCSICAAGGAKFAGGWNSGGIIDCKRCGKYRVSVDLLHQLAIPATLQSALSAACRQAHERGKIVTLDLGNLQEIARPHLESRISERVDLTLQYVAKLSSPRPGTTVEVEPAMDYPVADAISMHEFSQYIEYLASLSLITAKWDQLKSRWQCVVTIPGWQQLEPSLQRGGIPGRCFVALHMNEEMKAVYASAIRPAIIASGFEARCMIEIQEDDCIRDRTLAEIRQAELFVADFTGQRQSVYFEAGFARALGRRVISCCREDEIKKLHFDTRGFGHLPWKDASDLRAALQFRIQSKILTQA